jgi:hypothetical protein
LQSYEESHRDANRQLRSLTYTDTVDDLGVGAKKIVLTLNDAQALNPHTGLNDVTTYIPVFANRYDYDELSGELRLEYSGLLTLPGNDGVKSYQIIQT